MKILIIRLSSIGDIVLTSPVVRCLKQQKPDVSIHYLVKKQFATTIQANPYIDKVHLLDPAASLSQQTPALRAEKFDYIIDLHNNQRTWLLKKALKVPSQSFYKLNIEKWLMTTFKYNRLPNSHIVDRYLKTVANAPFNIVNDGKGLDYFIAPKDEIAITTRFPTIGQQPYIALAIGASLATKKMPNHKLINLCELLAAPIVLLGGGKADIANAEQISNKLAAHQTIVNACGELNLNQSASVAKQAQVVISHDTGMMHIAAAFNQKMVSIWGNTIPEFGMYPYLPKAAAAPQKIMQVLGLKCRPCSKLGYKACPKKHFNCMELINENDIADWVNLQFSQQSNPY